MERLSVFDPVVEKHFRSSGDRGRIWRIEEGEGKARAIAHWSRRGNRRWAGCMHGNGGARESSWNCQLWRKRVWWGVVEENRPTGVKMHCRRSGEYWRDGRLG